MQSINNCFNIFWFLLFGWELCLIWSLLGIIYYVTYFGIPLGIKCFQIGFFALWPFGKKIIYKNENKSNLGCIINIIWLFLGGLIISIFTSFLSLFPFITIIGMPFGIQLCKLSKVALIPLQSKIVDDVTLLSQKNKHPSLQNQNIPPSPQDEK